jgi:hypothetical protein
MRTLTLVAPGIRSNGAARTSTSTRTVMTRSMPAVSRTVAR